MTESVSSKPKPSYVGGSLLIILMNVIKWGLPTRTEDGYLPNFQFDYADGRRPIRIGSIIGAETEE